MERPTTILWFRGADLRLADNPAVETAAALGGPVLPLYVHDPDAAGVWRPGASAGEWLARSLGSLEADLRAAGSRLVLRAGTAEDALTELARETGASRIVLTRRWEPWARSQESRVVAAGPDGVEVVSTAANLLAEPGAILSGKGTPYRVFTPFYRRWRERVGDAPDIIGTPRRLAAPGSWPASERIDIVRDGRAVAAMGADVLEQWTPGERGAAQRLGAFTEEPLGSYETDRDRPDLLGTSRLSAHLAHGEVSVARVATAVQDAGIERGSQEQAESFVRQLAWREFAAHILASEPSLPELPVRAAFERFPWREDAAALEAWQQGTTGFPIIDAGMNQLRASGWMHNRIRMLVASFLTKDLLVSWQQGQAWFWEHLVDADLANNAFGWQWVAGCGHDAAPYFRIFNPTTQARRFDPDGAYVKRWAPGSVDRTPIIEHAEARARALAAYDATVKG